MSYSRHLQPNRNHKILDVALLRLRFCSINTAKSGINSGAIYRKVMYGQTLILGFFPLMGYYLPLDVYGSESRRRTAYFAEGKEIMP